jgi:hypothetical protein
VEKVIRGGGTAAAEKKGFLFSFYLPHGLTKQQQQQNNPTGIESNIPLPHPIIIASRQGGSLLVQEFLISSKK